MIFTLICNSLVFLSRKHEDRIRCVGDWLVSVENWWWWKRLETSLMSSWGEGEKESIVWGDYNVVPRKELPVLCGLQDKTVFRNSLVTYWDESALASLVSVLSYWVRSSSWHVRPQCEQNNQGGRAAFGAVSHSVCRGFGRLIFKATIHVHTYT